jgi:hypothetical protein
MLKNKKLIENFDYLISPICQAEECKQLYIMQPILDFLLCFEPQELWSINHQNSDSVNSDLGNFLVALLFPSCNHLLMHLSILDLNTLW